LLVSDGGRKIVQPDPHLAGGWLVDYSEDFRGADFATSRPRPGVGAATIYRHLPTRTDLIIAVYRH